MVLHWYKRYPEAALSGMKRLTLEERGAYDTVLDLIYLHDGELDDDDLFIAGWCSCDVRIWRRIKVRLLALGKLYQANGKLRNGRSDTEVAKALARVTSGQYAGQQSGISRAAKSRHVSSGNNGLASTDVPTEGERALQPSLGIRNKTFTETTSAGSAPSAPAPDGARSGTPGLTNDEIWRQRLAAYDPHRIRETWKPAWGARPDAAGQGHLIPPEIHRWWRAQAAQARQPENAL